MFSTTFIESNSAAYWNTMPNLRRSLPISTSVNGTTSTPSTQICPESGLQQAHEVLHQHRLPLPRAADDDVGAPALDVEIDAAQDVLRRRTSC